MATTTTTVVAQVTGPSISPKLKQPAIAVENKQVVQQPTSHQQSLNFVQILILVAVSSIIELRNLLPFDSFEDRDVHTICKDIRAVVFDNAGDTSSPAERSSSNKKSRTTKRFKIVNRGASAATEKLYTWFDGIFHGISQEYIESVQMSIIAEKHKPEHVLESYLFSLQYNTKSQDRDEIGIALSSSLNTKPVTITRARSSIYGVMRHLCQLLRTLPDLPENRYLTFNLFFTKKCPVSFRLAGFKASSQTTMLVPNSTQWNVQTSTVGGSELGFHNIEVKVAYLRTSSSAIQEDSSTYQAPSDLVFNKLLSRTTLEPISEGNFLLLKKNVFGTRSRANTMSTASARSHTSLVSLSQPSQFQESHVVPSDVCVPGDQNSSLGRLEQVPNTSSMRDRLLAMARSQSINSRLTQTQDMDVPGEVGTDMPTWTLIPSKDDELYSKREQFLAQPGFIFSDTKIQCQCGVSIKEGGMTSCDCCDTWQHKHCYALDKVPEDFLGNTHVCYDCLLGSTNSELLINLQDAAKMRRTFWMIRVNGPSISKEMLITKLGYQREDALTFLEVFISADLVILLRDTIKVNAKAADTNFENQGFLHPLSHISHLFENIPTGSIDSSPPRGQKRGIEEDQLTQSSDSQDLNAMVSSKKRKVPSLPCTPRRHLRPFTSSMEAQSPVAGGGDI